MGKYSSQPIMLVEILSLAYRWWLASVFRFRFAYEGFVIVLMMLASVIFSLHFMRFTTCPRFLRALHSKDASERVILAFTS